MNLFELTSTEINQRGMSTFEPRWMREQRMKSWESFQAAAFPNWIKSKTPKLDLAATAKIRFPEEPQPITVERQVPKGTSGRIVIIDDQLFRVSLKPELANQGVVFCDLQTAVLERADLLERYLKDRHWVEGDKVSHFHQALWNNGAFLFVPVGLEIDEPFQVQIIQRNVGQSVMNRNIIILDQRSQATVEEICLSDESSQEMILNCSATEAIAEEASHLRYSSTQHWSDQVYDEGFKEFRAMKYATIDVLHTILGGHSGRTHIKGDSSNEGASIEHNGILIGSQKQRFKIIPEMKHEFQQSSGMMRYKGILKDEAYAFLDGLIQVLPAGRGSQSRLEEETLLLGTKAHCDALPALDIQTDQVQVSHAASIRQADKEQVFYLMSRGLDHEQARNMIIEGFFESLLKVLPSDESYQNTKDLITQKLAA